MEEFKKRFGRRLRSFRDARGMSQQELADLLGRTAPSVSALERGVSMPSVETLNIAAQIVGCDVSEFFREVEGGAGDARTRTKLEDELWGLAASLNEKELAAVIKAAKAIVSVR